jgi:polyhydroxybutyrate depolymerase
MIRRPAGLLALALTCLLAAGCGGATGAKTASGAVTTGKARARPHEQADQTVTAQAGGDQGTGGMKTVALRSDGRQRTYLLYVPPGDTANHPLPLVLVFHGAGDTAAHTVDETDLPNIAQRSHNMILVFPQGYENSWNEGTGDNPAAQAKVNDVAFVSSILSRVEAHYAVDRRRVVATGFSNGALLTEDLGCALSRQLTMIAPVEGELPQAIAARCHPAVPLSVFEVHGTADSAIPYSGGAFTGVGGVPGPRVLSAPDSVARWAALDRCPAKPSSKTTGQVTLATYGSCEDKVTVTLATVNGGHHAWPSGFGPTLANAIASMSVGRTATS